MNIEFEKLLLTELNVVKYIPGDLTSITDADMTNALTVNENLKAFGYTLRPKDIVALAASETCVELYAYIQELLPDVKAKPMYPNFPTQVMYISEAMFKFHQALHYFSTYGVEFLTDTPVKKGWLPEMDDTDKTKMDEQLLELTVLELIPEDEMYKIVLERILRKRERMTIPETIMVKIAVLNVSTDALSDLKVTYKENLEMLFDAAMEMEREECIRVLSAICQHSGDVLKNIYRVLQTKKFHLRTAEKKTFVRLLEAFPVEDFRGNLMKSKNQREKNLLILQKLDFNSYVKRESHKVVVDQLRNDTLKSWEAVAKKLLMEHEDGALEYVSKRPGMMLRMVNWLLLLGYSEGEIEEHLCAHAENFSTHTLVKMIMKFTAMTEESIHTAIMHELSANMRQYQNEAYAYSDWSLRWQKQNEIDNARNNYLHYYENNKAKIEKARKQALHEWDIDELSRRENREIDILEAPYRVEIYNMRKQCLEAITKKESMLHAINEDLSKVKRLIKERRVIRDSYYAYLIAIGEKESAESYYQNFVIINKKHDNKIRKQEKIQAEIEKIKDQMVMSEGNIMRKMEMETKTQKIAIAKRYDELCQKAESMNEEINVLFNQKLEKLEQDSVGMKALYSNVVAEIEKRYEQKLLNRDKELARIENERKQKEKVILLREESQLKQLRNLPTKRRILANVLGAHMSSIETPLKNKSVYLDLDAYDLEHSMILGSDKSAEGGYIPSGIAYKIPNEATRVRFFVYWNDENRVDIDLHANGCTVAGGSLHIGWNGDYNNCGVTHSGDITHSDAAEYIDIDLSKSIKRIYTNVDLYSGKNSLDQVAECYVGMMAVKHFGEDVKLYDRANCYFAHEINQACMSLFYGYIDVEKRFVRFIGRPDEIGTSNWQEDTSEDQFTLDKYLKLLYANQNVTLVDSPEEADVVLSMGKSIYANGISLIDENFFMDVM